MQDVCLELTPAPAITPCLSCSHYNDPAAFIAHPRLLSPCLIWGEIEPGQGAPAQRLAGKAECRTRAGELEPDGEKGLCGLARRPSGVQWLALTPTRGAVCLLKLEQDFWGAPCGNLML